MKNALIKWCVISEYSCINNKCEKSIKIGEPCNNSDDCGFDAFCGDISNEGKKCIYVLRIEDSFCLNDMNHKQ